MSRNYKFFNQGKLHFVTYSTVFWIDVFTRLDYRKIIVDSLQYCISEKGMEIYSA